MKLHNDHKTRRHTSAGAKSKGSARTLRGKSGTSPAAKKRPKSARKKPAVKKPAKTRSQKNKTIQKTRKKKPVTLLQREMGQSEIPLFFFLGLPPKVDGRTRYWGRTPTDPKERKREYQRRPEVKKRRKELRENPGMKRNGRERIWVYDPKLAKRRQLRRNKDILAGRKQTGPKAGKTRTTTETRKR